MSDAHKTYGVMLLVTAPFEIDEEGFLNSIEDLCDDIHVTLSAAEFLGEIQLEHDTSDDSTMTVHIDETADAKTEGN